MQLLNPVYVIEYTMVVWLIEVVQDSVLERVLVHHDYLIVVGQELGLTPFDFLLM
jgi:hypothetical protein